MSKVHSDKRRIFSLRSRNLYVRRDDPRKEWWLRKTVNKVLIEENTHKTNLKDAELVAARIIAEKTGERALRGSWDSGSLCFDDIALEYAESRQGISQGYQGQLSNIVGKHLIPFFGRMSVVEVDNPLCRKYVNLKFSEGYRVADHIKHLRSILKLAIDTGRFKPNPPIKITNPDPKHGRGRLLNRKELAALLWATRSHPGQKLRDGRKKVFPNNRNLALQIRMGYTMGLRMGEACRARWDYYDLKRGKAYLPPEFIKTKKTEDRDFPLNRGVLRILRARSHRKTTNSAFIFPSPKNPEKPVHNNRTAFRNTWKRAGLPWTRFHHLRHSAITFMIEAGIPAAMVRKLVGVSEDVMRRYTHVAPFIADQAMNVRRREK